MLVTGWFREYLFTIVVVRCFSVAYGLANNNKDLTNEEKRGAPEEVKNEILSGEATTRGKTEKRGLLDIGSSNSHYERGPYRPSGGSRYGSYEPSGYDDRYADGYPHSGIGSSGHSGPGYYEEGHHQSSGSYGYPEPGHRPSGYGPDYGSRPGYGPPYPGYEEDHHHHYDHGGGGGGEGHGIGNFKSIALKKLLLPLAGLAILGVAAVASQNPVLLQLGVVNGRRKRSALPPDIYPPNPNVRPQKKY